MTLYVGHVNQVAAIPWCHLTADSWAELVEFRARHNLAGPLDPDPPSGSTYVAVTVKVRELAVEDGAVQVDEEGILRVVARTARSAVAPGYEPPEGDPLADR